MMKNRLAEMEAFVRVADTGSFSAAARQTGSSQSQISKIVKALETRLGVRLVNRTTRRLALTDAGDDFYRRSRLALAAIAEAEDEVRGAHATLRGTLRINTSGMLGAGLVVPAVIAFRAVHPELRVEAIADERRIDPVEEGVDLIVRIGTRSDLTLVGRLAGNAEPVLVASPDYLRRRGTPRKPADLAGHDFIDLTGPGTLELPLTDRRGRTETLTLIGNTAVSSGILVHTAARAGAGIGLVLGFLVADDLASGRLVRLFPRHRSPGAGIWLYHPFGRTPPRKVSLFMAFAIDFWRRLGLLAKA